MDVVVIVGEAELLGKGAVNEITRHARVYQC